MERTYIYNEKQYSYQVIATGVICGLAAVYSVFKMFSSVEGANIALWFIVLMISGYGFLSTFVLNFYPQKVRVSDTEIAFYVNKKWKTYQIDSIKDMNIRAMIGGYELFIRFTCTDNKKGHYWVKIPQFTDREDLIFELYHILWKINPKNISIKGQGRKYEQRPGQPDEPAYTEADFME